MYLFSRVTEKCPYGKEKKQKNEGLREARLPMVVIIFNVPLARLTSYVYIVYIVNNIA